MSMLSALMMLTVALPANAADNEEIVVIANRLKAASATVSRDAQGRYQCALSQSTGLVNLDADLCKAVTRCVRKGASDQAAVGQCVERSKPNLLGRVRDYWNARQTPAQTPGAGA